MSKETLQKKVLLIDNYDSFTYNLAQAFWKLGAEVNVFRNDKISIAEAVALKPTCLVISPGPCTPNESGNSNLLIRFFSGKIPVLGVCLGHQCIAQVFGARVAVSGKPVHGKTSVVFHDGKKIFCGIRNPFEGMRYHSLIVERDSLPDCLVETAWTQEGVLMGLRHREFPVEGVQFHPESFATPDGMKMLKNFLEQ